MAEYEALNPILYAKVLDELEFISTHKPFQILFYGSRERGDFHKDSDLNFYLLAHSTDQMKPSFIERVSQILQQLEVVAPVNMIAGDSESLRLRMKIFEPSCIQLLEQASVFYGEGIWEDLQKEWRSVKTKEIRAQDLISYLERRIRFFKQQTSRGVKDEISQLERICTLSLHVWAVQHIADLSLVELIKMDVPSQMGKLFKTLYKNEMDENTLEMLGVHERLAKLKQEARWKREINRDEIYELRYKLIALRKDEEFLLNY
ncbi:hypothetical protein LPTSP4_35120 [Leptospira ryugenii]|uniref:Nucleotidyltransferase domain protein n=1 Tax=Leptospira ryugenii TaxID=1917863 RepID=A0A2P2E535_9LEPT|nr:hypothetical protein [Leptospira ryugenii]GBF51974.1 hypothetical protein LPTSP4_35120 [Leptospira ryugenii]